MTVAAGRAGSSFGLLRAVAALGIVTITVLRCLAVFVPQRYFDIDPAIDPNPMAGIGMAGSLWLDAVLLVCAGVGLLGETLAGRGIDWKLLLLAFVPIPVIIWHGGAHAGDIWRGASWISAILAGVTVAHLARDPALRIIMLAGLAAVLAPLLIRSIVQVGIEHADTVRAYEANREQFLSSQGWAPGSPQAQMYERRLRQPQPTAWFTTTNILASLLAAGVVLFAGLGIAAVRQRLASGMSGVLIIGAIACAAMLALTGSKGAILAGGVGAVVLLALLIEPMRTKLHSRVAIVLIGLVLCALFGIVVRGMLPEDLLGDRSLLFRWHYLVSAMHMFIEQPWLGVGPDGFQAAYTAHRLPRNPEEVISAHSAFVDWLTMLGVAGLAWTLLVLLLVYRAGRRVDVVGDEPVFDAPESIHIVARTIRHAAVIAVIGMGAALLCEWRTLDVVLLTLRIVGIAAYFVAAPVLAHLLCRLAEPAMRWSLAAAVVVLVVHAQIEMTLFQHGSIAWILCVLGIAAGAVGRRAPAVGHLAALVCAGLAIWIVLAAAIPAWNQSSRIEDAAAQLQPLHDDPNDLQIVFEQRIAASLMLTQAYEAWPTNVTPLNEAVDQLLLACDASAQQPMGLLLDAEELAQHAVETRGDVRSLNQLININVRLAMVTESGEYWSRASALAEQVAARDPNGIEPWRQLGDLRLRMEQFAPAAEAYERALRNSDNFELDPLKQLSEQQRREVERRRDDAIAAAAQKEGEGN